MVFLRMNDFKVIPRRTKLSRRLSYSIGIEASHPPLCPLSWSGIPEGAGHIFDSPVAPQAAVVYSLPAGLREITGVYQIESDIRKICSYC